MNALKKSTRGLDTILCFQCLQVYNVTKTCLQVIRKADVLHVTDPFHKKLYYKYLYSKTEKLFLSITLI